LKPEETTFYQRT